VSPECLLVFIDDTGHERLLNEHQVYGLGGCAALAADLDAIVRNPWREVRRQVAGAADAPLHAVDFGQGASLNDIEVVAGFFRSQPFARLGAIVTLDTQLPDRLTPVQTIAGVLSARIAHIARWTRFSEIKVILESSHRADRLIVEAFQGITLQEDGKTLPLDFYFMPKSAADPALEVADFIMHAVGRQARHQLSGKAGFTLDFAAVFHSTDSKRVSFLNVSSVVTNSKP